MSSTGVLIGVIGGSGLYHLDNLTFVEKLDVTTPWGSPSSPITIASLPSGAKIAFLARHGALHTFSPSAVPFRANIAALKSIGVRSILAFSAVGSLREEIVPGDFIIPDQIIDRTKGIRTTSFFDGTSVVAHSSFGDPFSNKFISWLELAVRQALESYTASTSLHVKKTIVCMEGPAFSTRAESLMYRQWGGDLINMSVLPEAKLAREAEISYALLATATDYDSWRPREASVTAADVFKTLQGNAEASRFVAAYVLEAMVEEAAKNADNALSLFNEERGTMKLSIMPRPEDTVLEADKAKLRFVLPEYF